MTSAADILAQLEALGSAANRAGMARFGIHTERAYGVSVTALRQLARPHRNDHALALALWQTGMHEARILASIVDDPARVTARQMDAWVKEFDSWDLCDQCCINLFCRTPFAHDKAQAWSRSAREFTRRAGFALMAALAVHDKDAADAAFLAYLPLIAEAASDERNFVKKAVNWALRQIGKRNARLYKAANAMAAKLAARDNQTARWVGKDALREFALPEWHAKFGKA